MNMKVLSWNCRGLENPVVFNVLKILVKKYNPSCIFLCETKGSHSRLSQICSALGFYKAEIVEANGSAGGLCLMWSDDIEMEISWKSDCVIHGDVLGVEGIPIWSLLACYGLPYYREKK